MKLAALVSSLLLSGGNAVVGGEIQKLSLQPVEGMQRAELLSNRTVANPKAVLVLCPGYNSNGEELITQKEWSEYARKNALGLVELSFASDGSLLQRGKGYYYPAQGSGELLLYGLQKIYGRDLPILLYGFSGGAHFTSRFAEWKPDRVLAWCAYSAAWWNEPEKSPSMPPGIVVCGDRDPSRYGASLLYFKKGRALGKPWLWVSLPDTGHQSSGKLDRFVRTYFEAILRCGTGRGVWMDIDRKEELSLKELSEQPSLSAWLPQENLIPSWKELHEP